MVYLRQFPIPTEGVRCEQLGVEAIIDDKSSGKGTLYITEEIISWINTASGGGFTIPYKRITLHAISRDPNVHSSDCLYVMINGILSDDDEVVEETVEQDCEDDITEVRFVPDDSDGLNLLYQSVQQCTLLHPDPVSDMTDTDDEDIIFEGHEGGGDGIAHGLIDDDDDIGSEDEERIRQFERMQLHYGGGGDTTQNNGNGAGNENGHSPIDPDQFADAD